MNILNRMKLWQKLALMVAVLLAPTVYLVTLLVAEKNISINHARNEMAGIEYLKPVYSLLVHALEHRSMHYLLLSGDAGINTRLQEKQQVLNADIEQVAEMEALYGQELGSGEQWAAVRNGWENLKNEATGFSREESFVRHSALLHDITSLIKRIHDTSGLVLDPDLDTSYLIDEIVTKMPALLEVVDTLRARSAAQLLSAQSDESMGELASLAGSVRDHVNAIRSGMEESFTYNDSLKPRLVGSLDEFKNKTMEFADLVNQEVIAPGSNYGSTSTLSAQDLFQAGTTAVTAAMRFNEQTIPTINQLLRARIDNLNNKKNLALVNVSIGIVISLLIVFFITRYISQNVYWLVEVIKEFSRGKLNIDLYENNDKDEISHLFNSLHDLQEKLAEVISSIRTGTTEVGMAAEQVAQGNANLSQRTQEQASSLEEVASSMEEMTGTVSQNADNAQQANQLAMGAREQADAGGAVVSRAIAAMGEINESSKKIADIIGVIDEIAFQTNLLALNAAVEAARAGEQGRGFAVVASEVRNLAGRSATAAKEIKALIQDSVAKTQDGTKLVDESGHALTEIVQAVKKVSDIVAEIAAASREQSEGINQVNKALLQMDDMTQQNAALVEEAAAAAEAIDGQSRELENLVQFFKIKQIENSSAARARVAPALAQAQPESGQKPQNAALSDKKREEKNALPKLQTEDDSDWKEF